MSLKTNTTELQSILDAVNALPDISGGTTENLDDVLARQDKLITDILVALEGKAVGGTDTRFVEVTSGTLVEIDDDAITSARQYAFAYIESLKTARLSNLTTIANSLFRGCSNLEAVYLPKVTNNLGAYTFMDCSSLKIVDVKNATNSSTSLFHNCTELERVEFGNMRTIGTSSFSGCTKLTTLIIRGGRDNGANPPNLSNQNAFNNTPIANGMGYIYIPSSLLSQYRSGTNWSVYADQFRVLEDYTVDGTITGVLDESKI